MDIIFQANNLTKRYGKHCALNGLNMKVQQGEIYGLVGNNGAGKSTIMKIILGLSSQTSGDIELFGVKGTNNIIESRKLVSGIVELPTFYPHMTGSENLKVHLLTSDYQISKNEIETTLNKVGLQDVGKKKVKNYSLGMKQRLGIARALLTKAKFIILDEPTNGLDIKGMVEFRSLIKDLNTKENITFLISSHYISELEHIITYLGIINNGKMIKEISMKDLNEELRERQDKLASQYACNESNNLENYVLELSSH